MAGESASETQPPTQYKPPFTTTHGFMPRTVAIDPRPEVPLP